MNRVIVVVFFQLFSNLHHHYLAVIGKLPVQEWDLPLSSPFLDRKAGRKVVEIRSFFLSVTFYDWSDSRGSGSWLLFWGKYFQNCLSLTFTNIMIWVSSLLVRPVLKAFAWFVLEIWPIRAQIYSPMLHIGVTTIIRPDIPVRFSFLISEV